jgi:hypothetical protein
MTTTFENLNAGDTIDGPHFAVSRECSAMPRSTTTRCISTTTT